MRSILLAAATLLALTAGADAAGLGHGLRVAGATSAAGAQRPTLAPAPGLAGTQQAAAEATR